MKIDFQAKKGFICDMDGVLYHGNRILPGAAEFVQWLQRENKEYLFLTNNSGMTPKELRQKLGWMCRRSIFIPVLLQRRPSSRPRPQGARPLSLARRDF